MLNAIKEILPYLITALCGIITAGGTLIVSIFNAKKKKYEYQEKLSEEKAKILALEVEKLKLEELMLEGAFIICPNCKTEIKAKDMIFYTNKKELNENEVSNEN